MDQHYAGLSCGGAAWKTPLSNGAVSIPMNGPIMEDLGTLLQSVDRLVERIRGQRNELDAIERRLTGGAPSGLASGTSANQCAPAPVPPISEQLIHAHKLLDQLSEHVSRIGSYVG
jgi:hypothetical protein